MSTEWLFRDMGKRKSSLWGMEWNGISWQSEWKDEHLVSGLPFYNYFIKNNSQTYCLSKCLLSFDVLFFIFLRTINMHRHCIVMVWRKGLSYNLLLVLPFPLDTGQIPKQILYNHEASCVYLCIKTDQHLLFFYLFNGTIFLKVCQAHSIIKLFWLKHF